MLISGAMSLQLNTQNDAELDRHLAEEISGEFAEFWCCSVEKYPH